MNLDYLIEKYPEITSSIEQIEEVINRDESKLTPEYTVERFFERFSLPVSPVSAKLLGTLEDAGILNKIVRVESKIGGGIEDFRSILDVPDVIHDFRTDTLMVIEPNDLRVIYKIIKSSDVKNH